MALQVMLAPFFDIGHRLKSHLTMLAMVLQVLTLMVCLLLKYTCIDIDRK